MPHEADETQPLANHPSRNRRIYIPATWAKPGEGGGAPKLSGGQTIDKQTGDPAPRGLNRPDQRYRLPIEEVWARRADRAEAEYPATVIAQGCNGNIELRAPSGNNYELTRDGTGCDCPDQMKLSASYEEATMCKHGLCVLIAMAEAGGYENLPMGVNRLAEVLGIAQRTAEQLCANGKIPATKRHEVWLCTPGPALFTAIATYLSNVVPGPREFPELYTEE